MRALAVTCRTAAGHTSRQPVHEPGAGTPRTHAATHNLDARHSPEPQEYGVCPARAVVPFPAPCPAVERLALKRDFVIPVGRRPRPWRWVVAGAAAAAAAVLAYLVVEELHSSRWQAQRFAEQARDMRFELWPGANTALRVPAYGPFDERLGYTRIPQQVQRLSERGYAVSAQAWQSPALVEHLERGRFAPFPEKTQAGLTVLDCRAQPLYQGQYPQHAYAGFDQVPPLLATTLAFVEDRGLLAADAAPTRNPVIDPARLGRAVADQLIKRVDADHSAGGGSTLATQIEKYRHSPDGRTAGARDKLRQISSASLRVYADGEDTRAARQRILLDYVNTVPLGALRGWGEVHGLPDGLHAWFGADVQAASQALRLNAPTGDALAEQALAYRQALSLIIAQRRPAWYLGAGREQLQALTDSHLRLLATGGVITVALRDVALATPTPLRERYPVSAAADFAQRKAVNAARLQLAALLDTPRLYDLDRIDLAAATTIDGTLQDAVTEMLQRLRDPQAARAAGLVGEHLLRTRRPARGVIYSFTLYEQRRDGATCCACTGRQPRPAVRHQRRRQARPRLHRQAAHAGHLPRDVAPLHAQLAQLPARRAAPRYRRRSAGPADALGGRPPARAAAGAAGRDARRGDAAPLTRPARRNLLHRRRRAPLRQLRPPTTTRAWPRAARRCATRSTCSSSA